MVRLLPPLSSETPYHVAVTTPYIPLGIGAQGWLGYFARHQVVPGTLGVEERLHRHLKSSWTPDYWVEYVFYGYVNYRADAIFLTGLPDRPTTQPQHKTFDPRTAKIRLSA